MVLDLKEGCRLQKRKKRRAFGTGGCLAVQGRAVLPALLLILHEGQLPANQLPSRTNKLDPVLGNGEEEAAEEREAAMPSVRMICRLLSAAAAGTSSLTVLN